MATKSSPHWLTDLLKDKFVKISFKIILSLIMLFLIYIVGKAIFGYQVKILGFEVNTPIPKTDTIIKKDLTNIVVPQLKDSATITPKQYPSKIILLSQPSKNKSSQKDTNAKVQSTVTGDNNKTVIGNNSGIVGDVTINNGSPQRHLTQQYAVMLINRLQDTLKAYNLNKNVVIEFGSTMGSDESLVFSNEVANLLFDNGYTNISHNVSPTIGNNSLRILYDSKRIFIDVGMKPPK